MILQDIVISPDILDEIKHHYEDPEHDLDTKSFNNNIKLKKIIFDDKDGNKNSSILEEYYRVVRSCNYFVQSHLKYFIDAIRIEGKSEFISLKENEIALLYNNDNIKNVLLNLALRTESKIVNSQSIDKAVIRFGDHKDKLKDVEIINYEEHVSPPSQSSLFVNNRTINLEYKDTFEIGKVLRHYLINTEKIDINDKFLRNPKGGFRVLSDLLKVCLNVKAVTIFTDLKYEDKKIGRSLVTLK